MIKYVGCALSLSYLTGRYLSIVIKANKPLKMKRVSIQNFSPAVLTALSLGYLSMISENMPDDMAIRLH